MTGKRPRGFEVPEHEVRRVLKDAPDQGRTVLLTRYRGIDCVTRVWHSPVGADQLEVLRRVVAGDCAQPCALPADLASDLEGYRVRAALGEFPYLPEIVHVGLIPQGESEGFPCISTRWVEGSPLHLGWRHYTRDRREQILRDLLGVLSQLHDRNVLHGDLKTENVIVGAGKISLIDLDTLRQVPDAATPATISQITALYSAPEQSHEREAYPASDLFAYGVLVALLLGDSLPASPGFPPELPPPWNAVMNACLREKPLDRARTGELLKALAGKEANLESWDGAPVDEITVRVPDPGRVEGSREHRETRHTERVVDTPVIARHPDWAPSPRRRSLVMVLGWSWRRCIAAVATMLVLLAVGSERSSWHAARDRARDPQASMLLSRLHAHKTERDKNNPAYLAAVVDDAQRLASEQRTSELWGLYSLALVWEQGWHFSGATWDVGRFTEADELTRKALDNASTAEPWLARAILTGAACRLGPRELERRSVYCEESRDCSRKAIRLAPDNWLMVETLWNAVLVNATEAGRASGSGRTEQGQQFAREAMDHCRMARNILSAAPVNGIELAEDCTLAAARAADVNGWLWWTHWASNHRGQSGREATALAAHIFRSAHPDCASLPAERLNRSPVRRGSGTFEYCAFLTFTALGCPERAERYVCPASNGGCELPGATEHVPWDMARVVRDRAVDLPCELTE